MRRGFNGSCATNLRIHSHSHSPPRFARKESFGSGSFGAGDETKHRLRNEINLTKELIDFDVIKG
jgi:hypothetical protein